MKDPNGTGDQFSIEMLHESQRLSADIIQDIVSKVEVGMTETHGHKLINESLEKFGSEKCWHPNKFRIGRNTTKSFRDISDIDIRLAADDIYFIDIGPVFKGHEGDIGRTFSIGNDPDFEKIIVDAKDIFEQSVNYWKNMSCSGAALYSFAEKIASSLGYTLNTRMKGHRIGDFPHHVHYRGGLGDSEIIPIQDLWVLEIHIIHKSGLFGAFYEDLLGS